MKKIPFITLRYFSLLFELLYCNIIFKSSNIPQFINFDDNDKFQYLIGFTDIS